MEGMEGEGNVLQLFTINHFINCRLQGCVSSISSPELTHLGSIACPPSDRQPSTSGLATEDRSTWTDMASSWAA